MVGERAPLLHVLRAHRHTAQKMAQQTALIYSFVAKDSIILADYASVSGNFRTIAEQCLHNLPRSNNKHSYACDDHIFNFLLDDRFTYLVVSDGAIGRDVPFICLDRIKDDFRKTYGNANVDSVPPDYLDREYGLKLKDHMQYCADHTEEVNKLAKIRAQVSEVKNIMMDNIDKVLDRGEKINQLVDKTEDLRCRADHFQRQGTQVRWKLWFESMKMKLVVLGIVILVFLTIWLSICRGFNCAQ